MRLRGPRGERRHKRRLHRVLHHLDVLRSDAPSEHRDQPSVVVPEAMLH